VKVLAEIPARTSPDLRTGTLRRGDLAAYGGLFERLRGRRSVLMTGDEPARREVAAGLAAVAAAGGTRTALLECELDRPALADSLGLANAPGLHEYLRGGVEVEQILKPVALAGPGSAAATEPLVCVVAGRPTADSPSLFATEAFARALAGLRSAYDFVVVGGPGLERWGPLTLAMPHVEATIACVGPGQSRRKMPIPVAGLVVQN
jgi:tyrosine-protein kinase